MATEQTVAPSSKRRSWNPNMFLAHRSDLSSLMSSPPLSPPSGSSSARSSILLESSTVTPGPQRKGSHRRGASSISDWSRSTHMRTNSTLSSSQYSQFSSPASSVSRPRTPDSLDFFPPTDYSENITKRPSLGSGVPSKSSTSNSNRWSTSSSSLRHTSEQDRLLQEKLQQLARSENARLYEFEKTSSTPSSAANSRPTSFTGPSVTIPSEKRNSINISAAFKQTHQRNLSLQPYFNSNDKVPTLTEPRSPLRPTALSNAWNSVGSPVMSSLLSPASPVSPVMSAASKEAARASALAQLSGDIEELALGPSHQTLEISEGTPASNRRQSLQSPSQFVFSTNEILNLGNGEEMEKIPNQSSESEGALLPWRRTGDLAVVGSNIKSPGSLIDVMHYLWVMLSSPDSAKDINLRKSQWLPPAELVTNLKDSVMQVLMQASLKNLADFFLELGKVLGRCACTGLAFMIIFVQVSLLSVMVIAYVLGDILMSPFNVMKGKIYHSKSKSEVTPEPELTPQEQAKATTLKLQRAARKAANRRTKRRSRHN